MNRIWWSTIPPIQSTTQTTKTKKTMTKTNKNTGPCLGQTQKYWWYLSFFRSFPPVISWPWSYGSWIFNYLCNQCLSPPTLWVWILLRLGVHDTTLCDKVCQWLATGRWFSPGTLVSSTNKTDRHDITEMLLKVVLNTITITHVISTGILPVNHWSNDDIYFSRSLYFHPHILCTAVLVYFTFISPPKRQKKEEKVE